MSDLSPLAPHNTQCSTCSQTDNHLTMHYGDRRFHFDCVPADVLADVLGSVSDDERKRLEAVVAHASADGSDHLHGEALRRRHVELDPNQPDHVKRAVGVSTTKGAVNG